MRHLIATLGIILCSIGFSQSIDEVITLEETTAEITYLASDELEGRDTGTPGIQKAAEYILKSFEKSGVQPLGDYYFQGVGLQRLVPPEKVELKSGELLLTHGKELLLIEGEDSELTAPLVFAGHGSEEEMNEVDVEGKIVVTITGQPGDNRPSSAFTLAQEKRIRVIMKKGLGLVEIYSATYPWPFLVNFLNRERIGLQSGEGFEMLPFLWMNDPDKKLLEAARNGSEAAITIKGYSKTNIIDNNVVGLVEGTDPALKDEFILLSAHYDHVGIGKPDSKGDSINNGARDNAIGTVAVMNAAKYLAANPPRRSVIFLACTGEEKGMLGSKWYANHPLIPLEKTVFNLNTDGAGYNDTTMITVIGLGRTNIDESLKAAVGKLGLEVGDDPVPEQGLYDRSDNVSFAAKGVPAIDFAPGFLGFDQEIQKYYHQPADETDNLNFEYLLSFYRAFALTAEAIANQEQTPYWTPGDKYEPAGEKLYGNQ